MGCTASRVSNEDTVRRCKERRRLMKDAVYSRHHLAAAQSDYIRSLRSTAAALSLFASFQTFSVSDHTPPVLLHRAHPPPPISTATTSILSPLPSPPPRTLSNATFTLPSPLPPPPPPHFSPPPSQQLSPSPPPSRFEEKKRNKNAFSTRSTYSTTASQTSSAWNWENFYPPSPPSSDYFDQLEQKRREMEEKGKDEVEEHDSITPRSSNHHLLDEQEDEEESGVSSSEEDEESSKSGYYASFATSVDRQQRHHLGAPISELELSPAREEASFDDSSALVGDRSVVVRHRDLKEIVAAIEEYFVNAADAGDGLSDLLETGKAQLDRSFRQLRKTVYHSNSVLSNFSSTWSSKPPLAIKYQLDTRALEDNDGRKSHCSTLERLLAWEKKLYQEVKAREGVKIEHKKKLSTLQSQEYKGKEDLKLQRTKTSIQRLHSLIIVTSQAVSTTSSAIIKVRDDELAPQLGELCYGFMNMWRSMNHFHEMQNHIVQQVRGLVNYSISMESTSDLHRQATLDLESAVSGWHSSFTRLIRFHRDYVRALHAWLALTLFQVSNDESEKDHYSSLVSSELLSFCDEWKQALDRLPDTVAAESIKSFVTVIHSITLKQVEELKIKKRVESYSKELEKKSVALRNLERKFYQSYSTVGIALPNGSDMQGQVFDTRDPLSEKKSEIAACRRKVEDEMSRHTKAIKVAREMTLNNIQTGLPGVFQAITGFSGLVAEALEGVCHRAGSRR